jgi:hypothetical protein
MQDNKRVYQKPTETNELPLALVKFLDGKQLVKGIGEAIRITTVDEDGLSRASLLSVGEVLAIDSRHLNFVMWPNSTSAKNITRTGHISLSMVYDKALWEVRLDAKPVKEEKTGSRLAFFRAEVKNVRVHRVDYADVLTSVTYSLHDPDGVIKRWEKQIEELRACA